MHEHQLADVIGKIYEAALNEAPWPDVLCAVADLCGTENAALVVVDSRRDYSTVVTPRADPEIVSAYAQHWWQHDPTAKATASAPVGQLTTLADTGRELFLQSPFHNEFWRRSGLGAERIATNLVVGDGMFSSLVFQTSTRKDEIDEALFEHLLLFVPHFVRAMNLARKLSRMEIEGALDGLAKARDCTGVIVVDAAARIIFADAKAEALLIAGEDIQASGGILRLAHSSTDSLLRGAIAACVDGGPHPVADHSILLPRGPVRSPLLVDVIPYRGGIARKLAVAASSPPPAAMLFLRDPVLERDARIAALRERYCLTPAEAALSVEMLAGDGRAAAAERCGISINTARTHLMRVFEKTGVSRQAELIRLLLD